MKTFFVGIKGVIIDNNKVLLLKTNNVDGRGDRWEFPGGRIDGNESIDQALKRELNEELLGIKNIQIHEILDAHRLSKDINGEISLVLIFYRVTAEFPSGINLSEEHVDAQWFSFDAAIEKVSDVAKLAVSKFEGVK